MKKSVVERRGNEILQRLAKVYSVLGIEVGVAHGRLSAFLLRENPNLSLIMLDRWSVPPPEKPYRESKLAEYTQQQWDAAAEDARKATAFAGGRACMMRAETPDAASLFFDDTFDFAFIDADHSYDAVKKDIAAWWPKIRPGGFLSGHDFGEEKHPGVMQAVLESFPIHKVLIGDNFTWFVKKGMKR